MAKLRRAVVTGGARDVAHVRAYMPNNYTVAVEVPPGQVHEAIVITGHDHAGWTLDGYVLPRLASGLIFAKEVTR